MTFMATAAQEGFEHLGGILKGARTGMLVLASAVGLCVAVWMFRDLFRFGRDGLSWFIAVGVVIFFSSVGVWLGGYLGALVGAPMLVAFGVGRFVTYRRKHK